MSNEIQQQGKQPVIIQYLDRYKDQIAAALPRHMTPDRMARIITTEVRKVPKLTECNPKSLFGAVIQASQLGLEPGNALGHAYLIPFKKDVTLIIGYRGMIDLARRSGQIVSIEARAVYENDEFHYSFGLKPDLQHKPSQSGERGRISHVYAVAHLKDGGVQWDVMTVQEVNAIRDGSQGYQSAKRYNNSTPWDDHYDEMAKKTVIRRLFKYLPVSIEMQTAVGLDEQADAGISQQNDAVITGEFMVMDEEGQEQEPITRTESVKEKLRGGRNDNEPNASQEPTGEITFAYVAGEIGKASNQDELDAAHDLINAIENRDHKGELLAMVKGQQERLAKEMFSKGGK